MMTELLTYLGYVALSLTGFYAVYYLTLRNSTLFMFNRGYLLGSFILSFLLPFINIPWLSLQSSGSLPEAYEYSLVAEPGTISTETVEPSLWIQLVEKIPQACFWLYLAGLATLLTRLGIALYRLYRLKKIARVEMVDGWIIHRSARIKSPASFMKTVFMPDHINERIDSILRHEQAHVRQLHTVDVLLVELGLALQWFNPIAWAYRFSIREIHEYLADEASIDSDTDSNTARRHYQRALLAFSVDVPRHYLIHTFSQPTLKNRIIMMNKKRNKPLSALKAAVAVPMALALLVLWADRADAQVSEKQTTELTAASDTIYVVDGKVYSSVDHIDPDDIKSINVTNNIETVTAYGGSEGQKVIEIILKDDKEDNRTKTDNELIMIVTSPTEATEEEEHTFNDTESNDTYPPPLYILNGEEVEGFKTVNPDDIVTMDVLNSKKATRKYGEKGKNGVVEIVIREKVRVKEAPENESKPEPDPKPDNDPNPAMDIKIDTDIETNTVVREESKLNGKVKVRKIEPELMKGYNQPMFVVNGEIYNPPSEDKLTPPMDPDKITNVTVLRGENALKKYGERGALNGVVEITVRE